MSQVPLNSLIHSLTFVTLSSAPRNVRASERSRRGLFECLTGSTAAGHCLHPKGINWKMKAHGSMIPCIKFCKKIKNSLKGQMLSYMSIKHNYGHCQKQLYHYQLYHCDYQQLYHQWSCAWSSLTVFVVFKTAGGGDLDFGMEVHVNSFQQITKEDQHRNHGKHFHLNCVNIYKSNLTKVD